nr:IS66 family insertion sequence element accessory protein TnpB [uncultured Prevotella sp.]
MFVLNETNVFRVCRTPVDMCLRTLHLSQLVRSNDFNPSGGIAYVIYNRSHSRIKLLYWKCFGFVAYHKRMVLSARVLKSYGRMPDFMNSAGTNWYSMLKELGSMLICTYLPPYPLI